MIRPSGLCLVLMLAAAGACASDSDERCAGGSCDEPGEKGKPEKPEGVPDPGEPGPDGGTPTTCANGEEIPSVEFCDGKVDCSDGSDEGETCGAVLCLDGETFVFGDQMCDGINDCPDGWDEVPENCSMAER
jgi:hypothetical protein